METLKEKIKEILNEVGEKGFEYLDYEPLTEFYDEQAEKIMFLINSENTRTVLFEKTESK